jgi:hypothetical protein
VQFGLIFCGAATHCFCAAHQVQAKCSPGVSMPGYGNAQAGYRKAPQHGFLTEVHPQQRLQARLAVIAPQSHGNSWTEAC